MAESDDVQLPDLQVIQRYSLAVRGASAPRAEVIAALTADLEWLRGGGRRRTTTVSAPVKATAPAKAPSATVTKNPVRKAPAKKVPANKVPAKKAPAKRAPAKKAAASTASGARRR